MPSPSLPLARRVLRTAVCLTLTALVAFNVLTCGGNQPVPAQGVILISLDTLRADHLGLYGYERPTSPFLDELAERGVVFDQAYAQFPSTLTSHMSMLTGLYPAEHGVYPPAGTLAPEIPTVAELLQAQGIRTAGHTEGGYVRGNFGFRRGFDEFDARDRAHDDSTERTFRRGKRFLRSLAPEEPYFLFLHTYAVHAPYEPPEPYRSQFWPGEPPDDAFLPVPANLVAADRDGTPQSEEAVAYYRALYDAEIRHLDDVLRDFFEELAELGLDQRTTVIITSDHGEEFRDHGRFNHDQLYTEVIRVPFLVVGPGVEPRRSSRVVELVDVAPTVLELAGLGLGDDAAGTIQPPMSGSSLAQALARDASYPKRMAYAEASSGRRALVSSTDGESGDAVLHLLTFPGPFLGVTGNPVELYVTSADPSQVQDVAAELPQAVDELQSRLQTIQHAARAAAAQEELDPELRRQLEALGYLQ